MSHERRAWHASPWTRGLVLGLALIAALSGELGRWFAAAIVVWAGPAMLGPWWSRQTQSPAFAALRPRLPSLLVVAGFGVLLFPIWLGDPPVSRDHAMHYMQTQVFVDLVHQGQVRGFSQQLNTGYPFGDAYPILGYALTSALHLLSGGLVELRTSYAMGIACVWALSSWAIYALGQRAARELGLGGSQAASYARWAGAMAALIFLTDPGASRQGGWTYAMFHGVWPQLLSTGLWLASLEFGWRAILRPSTRGASLFGLALGASVVAHPFGMITGALSLFAWPIAWSFARRRHPRHEGLAQAPAGSWRVLALAFTLAIALSAGTVTTFFASAGSMARAPIPWASLEELASGLITGELFTNARALAGVLALLGIIAVARRGHALAWSIAGGLGLCLVLGSDAAITVLRLDLVVQGFENLQFPRYAFAAKGLWCCLAGLGGCVILLALDRVLATPPPSSINPTTEVPSSASPSWGRLWIALLTAPIMWACFSSASLNLPQPVGAAASMDAHAQEVDRLLIEELRAAKAGRVAFLRVGMSGATYPLFSIVDAGSPVSLDAHVPAVNYKHRMRTRIPPALRAMGVTHLIYDRRLLESDAQLARQLRPVLNVDGWVLAELIDATPRDLPWVHPRDPQARATLAPLTDLRGFRLSIDRHEGPLSVDIALGAYRKWRLFDAQGQPIGPVQRAPGESGHKGAPVRPINVLPGLPGLRVELPKAGNYELRWIVPQREITAAWISWIFLALALLALLHGPAWADSKPRWPKLTTPQVVALALIVVASGWGLRLRQQTRLQATWAPLLGKSGSRASVDLVDTGRVVVGAPERATCETLRGRDPRAGCSNAGESPQLRFLYRQPSLYRCLSIPLQAGESRELEFRLKATNEDTRVVITGFADGPVSLTPRKGESISLGPASRQVLTLPVGSTARARISLRNESGKAQRPCIAAAQG